MTYSTNVPNANQSPGSFPAQASTNWTRLKALIGGDHLFNNTSDTDDGYHKVVHWVKQDGTTTAEAASAVSFAEDASYTRAGTAITAPHLFHYTTSGNDTNKFPISVVPVRAYVVFNGSGTVGNPQTINSQYNVSSVSKAINGRYTINFTDTLPSSKYAVSISASAPSSDAQGAIEADISTSVTDSSLTIRTTSSSGSTLSTCNYISVTVYGG